MLFEPGNLDELRAAMVRLLNDEPLRRELRAHGIERAKQYRWDRSARLMTELLAEAAR
jgi:glycosyltransferase involved in cell wall biosynthesis